MNVLLSGVVGSRAYGLATPDSDIDILGVFAEPTQNILGLSSLQSSVVTTKPDKVYHEARKYCLLALKCNPTITELMWLSTYVKSSALGDELINIRSSFLSANCVYNAYLKYAFDQFRKLESRGDGSFSSDTRKRTKKHATHIRRLCFQGFQLYWTGKLDIKLEDPQSYRDFGEEVANGNIDIVKRTIAHYEELFDSTISCLPDEPNKAIIEDWLLRVRKEYW